MPRPKGLPKTGGRKKGTQNRLTRDVKDAILNAFDKAGGEDYLVTIAKNDPRTFCALLGRVIPSEVKAEVTNADDVLMRKVQEGRARLAAARRNRDDVSDPGPSHV